MCAIAGIAAPPGRCIDADILARMIGTLAHRGPDDRAMRIDGSIGLAHARLSIIDLEGGTQPMSNEDDTVWITFNGEIFNYLELREELIAKGHRFRTRSDTEVILHLYEEAGPAAVQRLNGQWAFAIWDSRTRTLVLSRDRMGVRPLFYTRVGDTLVFGSEIKSLFAHPDVPRAIDPHGLDDIFTFWTTLAPRTVFHRVWELPPGHTLTWRDGASVVTRHWELRYDPPSAEAAASEQEYAEALRSHLENATRIRLRSDVPVGAYLSGGLDSSVIASLIRRVSTAPLRTFSIAFDDAAYDESSFQKEMAAHLGTDHTELRCSYDDIGAAFPDVVWHAEKPLIRTAPAPMFLLSRAVREHGYKVVLTGEGADEILGGYDIFKETKIRRFWARDLASARRPQLLRRLYPYLADLHRQPPAYLQAFFHVSERDAAGPFFSHMPRWDLTARLKLFFSDDVRAALNGRDALVEMQAALPPAYGRWDSMSQAQYLEAAHLMPGYILSSQGDRPAMAHGVEGRFPFLDPNVVAFAATLPPSLKMKVLNEKYLLKLVSADLVPPSVRQRRKQPYRAPDGKVFFTPRMRDVTNELLSPSRLRRDGIFKPEAVARLADKFRQGRALGIKDDMAMVAIVSTGIILDRFIHRFDVDDRHTAPTQAIVSGVS